MIAPPPPSEHSYAPVQVPRGDENVGASRDRGLKAGGTGGELVVVQSPANEHGGLGVQPQAFDQALPDEGHVHEVIVRRHRAIAQDFVHLFFHGNTCMMS